MTDFNPLRQILTQVNTPPEHICETRYFFVRRVFSGFDYEELKPCSFAAPPAYFSFVSETMDELIIWSTNPFLTAKAAAELAYQIGSRLGWRMQG